MFTATYRLPLGVALFTASPSASADIPFEFGSPFGLIFFLWTFVGFVALVLIGLWQTRFVDPVEYDPARKKRLAFHRGLGGLITLAIGLGFGSAFQWIFGPTIASSVEPWLNATGQGVAQCGAIAILVIGMSFLALFLPEAIRSAKQSVNAQKRSPVCPRKSRLIAIHSESPFGIAEKRRDGRQRKRRSKSSRLTVLLSRFSWIRIATSAVIIITAFVVVLGDFGLNIYGRSFFAFGFLLLLGILWEGEAAPLKRG